MYGQEYVSHTQDNDGVRVGIRNVASGEEWQVGARYLVGADGARSLVRDHIGAKMIGKYGLSRNYNTIFRAPGLSTAHAHGPGIMYWQLNADAPSLVGPMDQGDLWYFMPTMLREGVRYTPEEMVELIRKATGIDLPYEILSSDEWVASRLQADRYCDGRVFLVGDACHLNPPFGGFGMNMGVADSVDLGWKISAVLGGWGGPVLLSSYDAERRVAHKFILDEAEANHTTLPNHLSHPQLEDPTSVGETSREKAAALIQSTKRNEFYALGVVLGYRYTGSPIIEEEESEKEWVGSCEYTPSAAPGCVAPHAWLNGGMSLYDLFGAGFTLLAFDDAEGNDVDQAMLEAEMNRIPMKVVRLTDPSLRNKFGASRALIRPDQHVAWRGDRWPAGGLLAKVSGWGRDTGAAGA
jgi:hypothetical protein